MSSVAKGMIWLILFITCSQLIFAQFYTHRYEAGISAGTFVYQGDLTPSDAGSYQTIAPHIGFFAARILNRSFSVRANFTFGKLKGDDALYAKPAYRRQRNFNFSTPVAEFSGVLVWNILAKNAMEQPKGFSPYLFAGAGVSLLHISRNWSNFNAEYFGSESVPAGLAADIAHRTPGAAVILPAGAGLKYALTPHISLAAETGYRFMFTDYLDGFSQGANPRKKDSYHGHSIGLIFSLGYKDRYDCPTVRL
ncbi:MAG TPA: DUF6089 family protein [Agriterribacter sp.]|mgnify:CR=1 FL=1|nr:DUF6089 family protein [Agriterribacter sp.]